jgi:hypothetical protein
MGRNLVDAMPSAKRKMKQKVIITKFADSFVKNGGNATQAIMEARPDLTYNSARTTGARILKYDDVQLAIQQALEKNNIDYDYILNARKQFVDVGLKQLNGQKEEKEPFVSPNDVSRHLQGIENIVERIGERGGRDGNGASQHLHLHLENKTPKEILTKRHELNSWFDNVLDND